MEIRPERGGFFYWDTIETKQPYEAVNRNSGAIRVINA